MTNFSINNKSPCWHQILFRSILLRYSCFLKCGTDLRCDYVNCLTYPNITISNSLSTIKRLPCLNCWVLCFFNKQYYDNICDTICFAPLLDLKTHLLSRSQDEALRTGVPCGLLVVVVRAGCSGRAGQGLDSLSRSSMGSGMLPMPVEALPTEWFLRWLNSDMLEEREWPVL